MGIRREEDGGLAQVSSDRLGTSDTFSRRLTSVQQLVLSPALHCLPQHPPHAHPCCTTGTQADYTRCVRPVPCFTANAAINLHKSSLSLFHVFRMCWLIYNTLPVCSGVRMHPPVYSLKRARSGLLSEYISLCDC